MEPDQIAPLLVYLQARYWTAPAVVRVPLYLVAILLLAPLRGLLSVVGTLERGARGLPSVARGLPRLRGPA